MLKYSPGNSLSRFNLRKIKNQVKESEDLDIDQEDDFDKIYKGEISKSGAAILPSKRVRRIPENIITAEDNEANKKTDQPAENDSKSSDNKTE